MTTRSGPRPGGRVFRRLAGMALLLALLFASVIWIAGAQRPDGGETPPAPPSVDPALRTKIDPSLLKELIEGDAGRLPIIVELKGAADLQAAAAEADPDLRRQAVVAALQSAARRSQGDVLSLLSQGAGDVRAFWIVNAVAASAGRDAVLALAARPEVRLVRRDREYHLAERPLALPGVRPLAQEVQWNIARVRADLARQALRVDGAGVVVANVDTGVDFLHPALRTRYRGYDPHGLDVHTCNWFDATGQGAAYPVDGNGHGTHTMGTMVGGEGIGMAPGASWIAIRAFNSQGNALESWLHAAMQWAIDPGPGCTPPDVLSSSWSNAWGGTDVFRGDVQALRAAGIFAPFAAGNDGPDESSVDAPASYPEAFAVGAVSAEDLAANFSGRGPATWYGVNSIKPEVAAPGVDVMSSLPGGAYGMSNGTSMATPHVAGLAALMLQANPGLSVGQIETMIKGTAVPLGQVTPNNDYGWGRIDAYAAVAAVAGAGNVKGSVTAAGEGAPIAGARLAAEPSTPDPPVATAAGEFGRYTLALAPDRYTLTASAFGFASTSRAVEVVAGAVLTENFSLARLPTGRITGRVTSEGQPVSPPAVVAVEGTPASQPAGASGAYTLTLPAGSYALSVTSPGHRVGHASGVNVTAGQTTVVNFDLESAPKILLVDTGAWYYGSQVDYYRRSLDELRYTYDLWTVRDPEEDAPAAEDLGPYDIVFWSSPLDSPGYIGASHAITSYLTGGGSLFLSGQDVAYYDDYYPFVQAPYFRNYLKARYVEDSAGALALSGLSGELFEGLAFAVEGPGGADNQLSPDVIEVADSDFASPALAYESGGSGGQQVGHCLAYRAVYLSFGFEAIANPAVRTEVISRSIAWFGGPPAAGGIELAPATGSQVGNFGGRVAHTLRLRNLAETGGPTDVALSAEGGQWATSLSEGQVRLALCRTALVTMTVDVPAAAAWAARDLATVTARSAADVATATRETRAPAPVLLVDDDRWYDVEDSYRAALEANGLPYDEWQVPWSFIGGEPPSPPLTTLRMYPMVLWFSAYDWYQPLTEAEEDRLAAYLDAGGRLYYNGQDYLYRSGVPEGGEGPNDFARTYLGVDDYTEDLTSTVVSGVRSNPVGSHLGPHELVYVYKNFSDALTPTASAEVAFVGEHGEGNALINAGPGLPGAGSPWRSAFFAFDPDGMSEAAHAALMRRVAGWLSWLGSSSLEVDKPVARDTDALTYTLTLRNDGWQDIPSAYFTATFPADLTPAPESITGGAVWDAGQGAIVWSGALGRGESRTFRYQADIAGEFPQGHVVSHTVWMGYGSHFIHFDRVAATPVNQPLWSDSHFSAAPVAAGLGSLLTYTLEVRNTGVADGVVTVSNPIPGNLALITDTLHGSGGAVQSAGRAITWTIPVAVGETASLSYQAVITGLPRKLVLRNRAILDDGLGNRLPVDAATRVDPPRVFLPSIFR